MTPKDLIVGHVEQNNQAAKKWLRWLGADIAFPVSKSSRNRARGEFWPPGVGVGLERRRAAAAPVIISHVV
jgi:hypothetical protein